MSRIFFIAAFVLGALAVAWMAAGFIGADLLALSVTLVIGLVYVIGFIELQQYRRATATLSSALDGLPVRAAGGLAEWLSGLHPSLQNSVRQRIEGDRVGLPAPVITPYLVGLLIMLGLLGTFAGMVDTLGGAVQALEGTTELQAIRAGLAAPINGLSLAFGTSVAGVAASAMLGLAATLSRRDRLLQTRRLDTAVNTVFASYSLAHKQQQTLEALQQQAQALPDVASRLDVLADRLEQMSGSLGDKLIGNQEAFHVTATAAYTELAKSVDSSLRGSLAESGRLAGESIKPVVAGVMEDIRAESLATHQQLAATARQQLDGFSEQLATAASATLAQFDQHTAAWVERRTADEQQRLERWVEAFESAQAQAATRFGELSGELAGEVERLALSQQAANASAADNFVALSGSLNEQWQQAGGRMQELSAGFSGQFERMTVSTLEALERAALAGAEQRDADARERLEHWSAAIGEAQQQARAQLVEVSQTFSGELRELSASQQLAYSRATHEFEALAGALSTQWQQAGAGMDALTSSLQADLGALREEEERRGLAAMDRLANLEATVATHLGSLGRALEDPMTRLIETASETPKAAAEVIGQLRQEISNNMVRDNELLEERAQLMDQLKQLSGSMARASEGQREAVEQLLASTSGLLQRVGGQFSEQVGSELSKMSEFADHFSGSAVEISSLGDAFTLGVELFSETNSKLIESLARIEESLAQSSSRSDEQMGYYVAQAREIIDQNLLSQQEIIEALREQRFQQAPLPAEAV